jgi:hypothetical protein
VSPLIFGGGILGLLLLALIFIITRAAGTVIGREATGWLPHLSRGLVARAVQRLPEAHRDRFDEEWRRHISDFDDRPLTGLVKALGYAASVRPLQRELAPNLAPAPVRARHRFIARAFYVKSPRAAGAVGITRAAALFHPLSDASRLVRSSTRDALARLADTVSVVAVRIIIVERNLLRGIPRLIVGRPPTAALTRARLRWFVFMLALAPVTISIVQLVQSLR